MYNGPPPDARKLVLGTYGLNEMVSKRGFPLCFNYKIEGRCVVLVRFQEASIEVVVVNPFSASSLCDVSGLEIGLTVIERDSRPIKFLSSRLQVIDSRLIHRGFPRELIGDDVFVKVASNFVDGVKPGVVSKPAIAGVPQLKHKPVVEKPAPRVATLPPIVEPEQDVLPDKAKSRGRFEL